MLPFQNRFVRTIAGIGILFNPLLLVLSNQIGNDAFFAALAISWFALMLWVILKKSWWAALAGVAMLFFAFQVRYNALYYPVIGCVAFAISMRATRTYRFVGMALTVITIALTYQKIKSLTLSHTGADVFSGFSGWQIANNALYTYKHIDVQPAEFEEPELSAIDHFVRVYLDSLPLSQQQHLASGKVGPLFIWSKEAPYKRYLMAYMDRHRLSYINAWYQTSIPLGKYGKRIILNHPGAFFRYYVGPNVLNYLYPDPESMDTYHTSISTLPVNQPFYFSIDWKALRTQQDPGLQSKMLKFYPAAHVLVVLLSFGAPLRYMISNWRRRKSARYREKILIAAFWLLFLGVHLLFSILTSNVVLRFEAMWFVLALGLPMWFLDEWIASRTKKHAGQVAINVVV